ncbi:MAG TPA: hypothetical protein VL128_09300 [Candidatus Eisenbacteria bacterium]|nr:hypothetical protein [Candidatus Eisenbacteria bacterium]
MKRPFNSSYPTASHRCAHIFPSGRRCRLAPSAVSEGPSNPASAVSLFCHRHRPKDDPGAELVRGLSEFRSVADVTVFLSRLIFALSKDQISTRRASVLSYVAVSLMHGFRSMQLEHKIEQGNDNFEPLPWTWMIRRGDDPDFVDIDDARAFYAQRYADEMCEKARQSHAEKGVKSPYYPYRKDPQPADPPPGEKPLTEDEALANYVRLRT